MPSRLAAVAVTTTYLVFTTLGCASNEYVIPKAELGRLAALPPNQRGANVHVIQGLGDRGGWAVDNPAAVPEPVYASEFADWGQHPDELLQATTDIAVTLPGGRLPVSGGPPGASPRPWSAAGSRSKSPFEGPRSAGNWDISMPSSGKVGDDLAVFAIVLVAVAVMAAAGLAVTEGLRYDGFVQLHPAQPVHLKEQGGGRRTIPLAAITAADVAGSQKAVVLDDEDYGFRFARRRPLDRKGLAFKVDMGSLSSLCACYSAAGFASNIQLGFFPHHRVGVLGTLALGGGTSPLHQTFERHSGNIEAQVFPLSWWRLHLGAFGHGGMQVARDELGTRSGQAWGAGAIVELALTTRLALTGRADYTTAQTAPTPGAWASTAIVAAGIAIY